jgi:hypothetical protein
VNFQNFFAELKRRNVIRAAILYVGAVWALAQGKVYALRKEPEKIFEWLEHAWATHDAGVTDLLVNPFLRAYKDDPRFIAFAQKIGVIPKAAAK